MKRRLVFLAVSLVTVAAVLAVAAGAAQAPGTNVYRLVGIFGRVLALVQTSYVEEVPMDRLELGAMNGLVRAADPGGEWVPAESAPALREVRERPLPAFGLVLGMRADYPFVLSVVAGSPAEQAGVSPGELIERIGDQPVRARPLWMARVLLDRAERADGQVTMEVIDRRLQGKHAVTLVQAPVAVPAVGLEMKDGVPVLRVGVIADEAMATLRQRLQEAGGADAVVVDLRGVALGTDAAALEMAAEIAGGDVALETARRDGAGPVMTARAPVKGWRVIVAQDATTAHAAEVLALALKTRGATLVGMATYGDAATREPVKARGGTVWMARQWFLDPAGEALLGHGLEPDEDVRYRPDTDAILDRALELARGAAVDAAA